MNILTTTYKDKYKLFLHELGFIPNICIISTPYLHVCSSTLGENAGLGLFARISFSKQQIITMFEETDKNTKDVILYRGRTINIKSNPNKIDKLAVYSNTLLGRNNATIKKRNHQLCIIATKKIYEGQEIFTSYGPSYRSTGGNIYLKKIIYGKFKD